MKEKTNYMNGDVLDLLFHLHCKDDHVCLRHNHSRAGDSNLKHFNLLILGQVRLNTLVSVFCIELDDVYGFRLRLMTRDSFKMGLI